MEKISDKLHISTITFISEIDSNIDLKNLYEKFNSDDDIKYIEYGNNPVKGEKVKKIKKQKNNKEKKCFYNQLTLHINCEKIVNVKIKDQGKKVVSIFLNKLSSLSLEDKELVLENINPQITKYKIALINSDFNIGFKINREILHRIIIDKNYYSSFEPSIYPGVNIKYYFNKNNKNNGICHCSVIVKLSISKIIHSGNIIITGGNSVDHLLTAHKFIHDLINERKNDLKIKE